MDEKNQGSLPSGEEQDEFVIGKGFTIPEEQPVDELPASPAKEKKKSSGGALKNVIWIFLILVISIGLAFGAIYAGADYMGIGFGRGEETVIEIAKGSSTKSIADALQESGAVKMPVLFRLYAKFKHFDAKFQYGVYHFNTESGYEAIAQMLMEEGARAQSVTVTIPEMSTVDDMAKILEDNGVCTASDFIEEVQHGTFSYDFVKDIPEQMVYYRLEGYLFPETYDFYCYESKECAHLAVEKMLKTLDGVLTQEVRQSISNSGYSLHEVMTMASIVELEAGGTPDEASKVAAVFYNRLKSDDFMKLESSPTKKYPHGSGKYDTYQCIGLPPGPLCSPSRRSILAAGRSTRKKVLNIITL